MELELTSTPMKTKIMERLHNVWKSMIKLLVDML